MSMLQQIINKKPLPENPESMQVWVRIHIGVSSLSEPKGTSVGILVRPELYLVVYPSEEAAKAAVNNHGGLALVTETSKLKELFRRVPQTFVNAQTKEITKSEPLIDGSYSLREPEDCCGGTVSQMLTVDCGTLPHHEEIYGGYPEQILDDEGAGAEWLSRFETAMGAHVHFD
jgi:hypothetical protein